MVDNYVLVITTVSGFVNILFYSVMGSLGNVIAIESKEKQYLVFRTYRFLGAWIYGFSTVGYMLLLTQLKAAKFGVTQLLRRFLKRFQHKLQEF